MNKKKAISWFLVIIWMGFIFYLSHQTATESSKLSNGVTKFIAIMFNTVMPNIEIELRKIELLLRNIAHFLTYFILGFFVINALSLDIMSNKSILLSLLFCIFYAFFDEIHQLFIAGRCGEYSDFAIDILGSMVSILLYSLIYNRNSRIKYHRQI